VIEKYDYDSIVQICHPTSSFAGRQGGYVVISDAKFEIDKDA
jgi:hypothetical protein